MRAYRAGRAFDGDRPVPGGALVVVDGSRIEDVQPGWAPAPEGCELVDVPDGTLLPGLLDLHVHLCGDSADDDALARVPDQDAAQREAVIRAGLLAHRAAGVTTVRDLGDHHGAVLARRHRPDEPTVLAAGPPITVPGGHCWSMGGQTAPDGLAAAVAERAARGADVVKLMVSGGAMTAGSDLLGSQYSQDQVALVVQEAHRHGLAVTAHAHPLAAVRDCLAAGVDGIEHGTCLTERGLAIDPELFAALAAARTPLCPTLGRVPGSEPSRQAAEAMRRTGMTLEARLAQVAAMHAAGVLLLSGSDAGIHRGKPHGVLPHAVAELCRAGVPAADALATATGLAADACGLRTGRLRAGLAADLLLVEGDPLAAIGDLTRVHTVVVRGRAFSPGPRPPASSPPR